MTIVSMPPSVNSTIATPTYRTPADWYSGSTQTWRVTVNGSATDNVVITVLPITGGLIGSGSTVRFKCVGCLYHCQ
jgi:hypothetical protein